MCKEGLEVEVGLYIETGHLASKFLKFFLSDGSTRHAYDQPEVVHGSHRPGELFSPPQLRGPRSFEAFFYVWRVDDEFPKKKLFSF
jgi:hypothetical protein